MDWVAHVRELSRLAGDSLRWDPPTTSAALARFEVEHAITLPADYKQILLELGDGSEGAVNIFPLGEVIWGGEVRSLADWFDEVTLATPFPRAGDTGEIELVDGGALEDDSGDDDDESADWSPPGALPVADNGAGGILLLVVSGAEYGRLWEQGGATLVPAPTPLVRPVGFAEWLAAELAKRLGRSDLLESWRRS